MIVVGILLFHTVDIPTILSLFVHTQGIRYTNIISISMLNLFVLLLLGAAFIKSAQIGPHI